MVCISLPSQQWLLDVGPIEGAEVVVWDPSGNPEPPAQVNVFVAPYMKGVEPIAVAGRRPSVQLIQLLTAGYDGVLEVLPERVTLANAGSVHDDSTAELALALTLAAQRGIPEAVLTGAQGRWERPSTPSPSLADRRVVIVGYGGVGRAIAARMAPFGVDLQAVASASRAGDEFVKTVHGIDELPELAAQAEVVVVAVPLQRNTMGLIGEDLLARLPDGALVVNVARGPVADTEAILRHAGRLRFALDVTDPEPLPDGHPLWSAPNVLITPHVGGASSAFYPRAVRMLREQLSAVAAGKPARNVVREGT